MLRRDAAPSRERARASGWATGAALRTDDSGAVRALPHKEPCCARRARSVRLCGTKKNPAVSPTARDNGHTEGAAPSTRETLLNFQERQKRPFVPRPRGAPALICLPSTAPRARAYAPALLRPACLRLPPRRMPFAVHGAVRLQKTHKPENAHPFRPVAACRLDYAHCRTHWVCASHQKHVIT